jgi:hypothetical protein
MFSSFWKIMPVLTIGLGVGLEAQNAYAPKNGKTLSTYQTPSKACGLNEGDCCLARSCKCAMGWAVEADFLYWRAENPGFTLAYEQKSSLYNPATFLDNLGSIVRLDAKWDPGFRLGAGWNTDFDRWDVFADWTWFKDHATKSHTESDATTPVGFYPQYPVENTVTASRCYKNVSGSWRLLHNAVDLELGRAFYITKALSLRPHWGLRGAWLNQKFKSIFSLPLQATYSEYDFHGKNNYWGIGPRLGIHGQWHIAESSWSILGKASTSLLLGKTKAKMSTQYLSGDDLITERESNDNFSQLVPNLQIFLGLDWGSCLDCEKYYLGINAGWETNIYWNQYNIPATLRQYTAPLSGGSNQAVTMEGLTVNMHLDF